MPVLPGVGEVFGVVASVVGTITGGTWWLSSKLNRIEHQLENLSRDMNRVQNVYTAHVREYHPERNSEPGVITGSEIYGPDETEEATG